MYMTSYFVIETVFQAQREAAEGRAEQAKHHQATVDRLEQEKKKAANDMKAMMDKMTASHNENIKKMEEKIQELANRPTEVHNHYHSDGGCLVM